MNDYVEGKKLENLKDCQETNRMKFVQYHIDNPEVWEMFREFTWVAMYKGCKHLGAKMVIERIRWETAVEGNDQFKVNNNYAPYYARMFMDEFPDHDGFFRTRVCNDEKEPKIEFKLGPVSLDLSGGEGVQFIATECEQLVPDIRAMLSKITILNKDK